MCHLLAARAETLPLVGCHVLELGAGVGMLGIVAAQLGAAGVSITDMHDLCLCAASINVALNGVIPVSHVAPLRFGAAEVADFAEASHSTGPGPQATYPLIVATDIVYSDETIVSMFETIHAMLERSDRAVFLLGWVQRSRGATVASLEKGATTAGLTWTVVDATAQSDLVRSYAQQKQQLTCWHSNRPVHERAQGKVRVWEFRWSMQTLLDLEEDDYWAQYESNH